MSNLTIINFCFSWFRFFLFVQGMPFVYSTPFYGLYCIYRLFKTIDITLLPQHPFPPPFPPYIFLFSNAIGIAIFAQSKLLNLTSKRYCQTAKYPYSSEENYDIFSNLCTFHMFNQLYSKLLGLDLTDLTKKWVLNAFVCHLPTFFCR